MFIFIFFAAEKKLPDLKGCETPRRALGDLKNVFATPVNSAMKRKAPEKSQSSFNVLSEESPVDEVNSLFRFSNFFKFTL